MADIPPEVFAETAEHLEAFMIQTANGFLTQRGFGSISVDDLHQMSPSFHDSVRQLMMFGANLWPKDSHNQTAGARESLASA